MKPGASADAAQVARAGGAGGAAPPAEGLPADRLVDTARALARGSSPHSPAGIDELGRAAGGSPDLLAAARDRASEMLRRHSQRNAGAADDEWLELHTARRLLDAALDRAEAGYADLRS